jgi:hypothetical protein
LTKPSSINSLAKFWAISAAMFSVPMVGLGDKLGLDKALSEHGPMTPAELTAKTNVAERGASPNIDATDNGSLALSCNECQR